MKDGLGLKQLLTIRDSGQVDLAVAQNYTAAVSSRRSCYAAHE